MDGKYNYIIVCLILIVLAYFYRNYYKRKVKINIKNINNEDVLKYEKLIRENHILKIARLIYYLWLVIAFILLIIFIKFDIINIFIFIFFLSVFLIVSYFIKAFYTKIYKKQIIQEIFNASGNLNKTYYAEGGITKEDYKFANFEKFGKYKTSDLIKGFIGTEHYELSSVTTYSEIYSLDNVHYIVPKNFEGVVSKVNLNQSVDSFLYIVGNKKRYDKKNLILIDDEKFNDKYYVYSNNEEIVKKLFNSDIKLEKDTNIYYEVKLYNDVLYFRFFIGRLFIPNMFSLKKDALAIVKYMFILDYMEMVMSQFIKVLKDK